MCFFACLPLYACQSDTNGSILYDHAKYVILLVKVKIVLNGECLPLCACQSDTNGSILYDHAEYVILLAKVKIVLNGSCNLKL